MSHITYTRVHEKHLKALAQGKPITIKPNEHNDPSNIMIEVHFKQKKHKSKLERNMRNNKGNRISPNEIYDVKFHSGNGFFDSIGDALSGIAKTVAPIAVGGLATSVSGNPLIGGLAGAATSAALKGHGINFGSIVNKAHGVSKKIAPLIARDVGHFVTKNTGNKGLGRLAQSTLRKHGDGFSFGSFVNKAMPVVKSIGSIVRPIAGEYAGNVVSDLTGSNTAGLVTKKLVGGKVSKRGKGLVGQGIYGSGLTAGGGYTAGGGMIAGEGIMGLGGPNTPVPFEYNWPGHKPLARRIKN